MSLKSAVAFANSKMKNWLASDYGRELQGGAPLGWAPNPGRLAEIYKLFKSNGKWDLKPALTRRFGVSYPYAFGNAKTGSVRFDVLGNVDYGVMMSKFGIPEGEAIIASDSKLPGVGQSDSPDDVAIAIGYALEHKYPNGPTNRQYTDFLLKYGPAETVTKPGAP